MPGAPARGGPGSFRRELLVIARRGHAVGNAGRMTSAALTAEVRAFEGRMST
jgi:hypothetical protein